MSWDQPMLSFEQRPPTPTRTPTSPTYADFIQTPKVESSFYDPRVTWNTADPTAQSPGFLRTPKPLSFETPGPSDHASQAETHAPRQGLAAAFATNVQHLLSTPDFSVLQVDRPTELANSGKTVSQEQSINMDQFGGDLHSVRSARSIQTPPPTSTSASKKPGPQSRNIKPREDPTSKVGSRPSAPAATRPATANASGMVSSQSQVEESPLQFSNLEFSPELFNYHFATPATAPAYPQQKLFWDPSHDTPHAELSHLPNHFGTDRQSGLDAFVSNHPAINSQPPAGAQTNFADEATPTASFVQQTFKSTADQEQSNSSSRFYKGVDPALLFSSPSRLPEEMAGPLAASGIPTEESLQPYAYQIQEAKREKVYGSLHRPRKRRKPSVDSPAVTAALAQLREDEASARPSIRRSMTDTGLSKMRDMSSSSRPDSRHGRSSPLKRLRDTSKKPRQHRTSIALTIDENGRARAEARVLDESYQSPKKDGMDLDSASSSSDSEDSAGNAENGMFMSFSQHATGPKMGRFNRSASHSQKSSYTSFYSSTSNQNDQVALTDMKHKTSKTSRLPPLKTLKEASTSMEQDAGQESEAETLLDSEGEDGSAQTELKKMRMEQQQMQARHGAGNGQQPVHHLYSPKGQHPAMFAINETGFQNISPTTITDPDLASPISGYSSHSDTIRCMCNHNHDEGPMLQCESCRKWLHVACTGLQPHRMPKVYLCLFCTGSTPAARGGRAREPSRKGYPALNSPLALKSGRPR